MHVDIYFPFGFLTLITGLTFRSIAAMMIDTGNASYTFRLRIFDSELSEKPWAFPHTVQITKRIYVEVQLRPINNGIIDDDLLAIPKNCFFSPNSNANVDTRHVALIEGCATGKSDVLIHKRNSSSADHAVRFSLQIDGVYFPTRHFMFLHCSATVCSKNGSQVKGNVEACLADGLCAPSQRPSKVSLATPDQPPHYVHVFSGPMRPVYPPDPGDGDEDSAPIPPWTVKKSPLHLHPLPSDSGPAVAHQTNCPPCPGNSHGDPTAATAQEMLVVTEGGLDTFTVFCIAAGSFAVGVLLMTGLCYVHRITDPKRCSSTKTARYSATLQPGLLLLSGHHSPMDSSTPKFTAHNSPSPSFPSAVASSALLLAAAKPKLRLPCCLDASSPDPHIKRDSKNGHGPQDPMLSSDDTDDHYKLKREIDG